MPVPHNAHATKSKTPTPTEIKNFPKMRTHFICYKDRCRSAHHSRLLSPLDAQKPLKTTQNTAAPENKPEAIRALGGRALLHVDGFWSDRHSRELPGGVAGRHCQRTPLVWPRSHLRFLSGRHSVVLSAGDRSTRSTEPTGRASLRPWLRQLRPRCRSRRLTPGE